MEYDILSAFGKILLFIIGAIFFLTGGLITTYIIRPKRPGSEKSAPYECGEEAVGSPWKKFNTRFYVIALIFILFEVELIFLFPWSTVFGRAELLEETQFAWGWFSLAEMGIFVGILVLGLAYAWYNGFIDWIKPVQPVKKFESPVPDELYQQLNIKMEEETRHAKNGQAYVAE